MPRKADWIQRLPEILARLREGAGRITKEAEGELLDRSAVETLFQVSSRQATRILRRLGAGTVGGALCIRRVELIERLESLAAGDDVQFERRRRHRLEQQIEEARREARSRQVEIPPSPSAAPGQLPLGVHLESGRLEVRYGDPVELLQKLMQLAQFAATDWEGFQQSVRSAQDP